MRLFLPALIIMLLGFAVFSPVLNSPFVIDDISQIVQNDRIKNIKNIPSLFNQSNVYSEQTTGITDYFYRPVFYSFYTILYFLGNGSPFAFHVFQVFVYNLNVTLVFILFSKFFPKKIALLISLIYLIHPANEEVAAYIANLQDTLYLCFGLISLNLIASRWIVNRLSLLIASSSALLSLLSKETGVLFLFITLLYVLIFQKKLFLKFTIAFSIVLFIYSSLRIASIDNPALIITNANQSTTLNQRLIIAPKIIFYYFEQMFAPTPHLPDFLYLKSTNLSLMIFPSFMILVILPTLIITAYFIRRFFKTVFPKFLFFLVWTFAGVGLHSQIIALDVPVASRWIYFPMIGVIGMIGVLITTFKPYLQRLKLLFLILYFLYLSAFTFATVKLNFLRQNSKVQGITYNY